jgi:hypothetical protein|uniref:Uncharacterized protein n=1 Tax=viral metagenome TaxID=1070528 RepID=A0A6C0IZ87_9ZZZZ
MSGGVRSIGVTGTASHVDPTTQAILAKEIYKAWRADYKIAPKTITGDSEKDKKFRLDKYKQYSQTYKQFASAYPVILRYMIERDDFHKGTFAKFVKYVNAHPPTDEKDQIENSIVYDRMLFRYRNPKAPMSALRERAKIVRKGLTYDYDRFKASKDTITNDQKIREKDLREDLFDILMEDLEEELKKDKKLEVIPEVEEEDKKTPI